MYRHYSSRAGVRGILLVVGALSLATLSAPVFAASSMPMLRGVVVLPDGSPAVGATVTLAAMRGLGKVVGVSYVEIPEATVTTDEDGNYELPLVLTPTITALGVGNGGFLNYTVYARLLLGTDDEPGGGSGGDTGPPSAESAYLAADLVYARLVDTGSVEPITGEISYVLSEPDPVRLETEAVRITGRALNPNTGEVDTNQDDDCTPFAPVVTTVAREVAWEPVGQVHTGWDTTAKMTYGATANTDLGGAFTYEGGPFKATTGMNHMGNRGTEITASYSANEGWSFLTKFEYSKERIDYYDDYGDYHHCWTDYRIVPDGWSGHSHDNGWDRYNESTWQGVIDADRNLTLAEFGPRDTFTKHKGRGTKYHGEVKAFGVGLYAQSTWSEQIDIEYTFGTGTDRDHYVYHPTVRPQDAPVVYSW